MSEPTAQELRLAALLHEINLDEYTDMARALLARGVRVEGALFVTYDTSAIPENAVVNAVIGDTADLDWRDSR